MSSKEYKPFYVSDEKWEREFSNTDKSLNDLYEAINIYLDYEIEYAEDRVKLLSHLINKNQWIYKLLSTEKIIDNHVKNKKDFLSENTTLGKILDSIVSFVVHPKYRNKEEKQIKQSKKEVIITKRRFKDINMNKEVSTCSNKMVADETEKKKLSVSNGKQLIEERDVRDFPEIRQMQETVNSIRKILGYGIKMTKEERCKFNSKLEVRFGKRQLKTIRSIHSGLQGDMLIAKEKLRGTIYFKRLDKTHTEYNFNSDTGYFNNDGDYIHISENKFEFKNKRHIAGLIKFYSDLKEKYKEKFTSDMWAILWSLDELIGQSDLTEEEKFILDLHFNNFTTDQIITEYQKEFNEEINNNKISRILNNNIPSKIQREYLDQYDEWLYTYKVKGQYKKCNSCGEIKLISNDRYFRNRNDEKGDGFRNKCRKCETVAKK